MWTNEKAAELELELESIRRVVRALDELGLQRLSGMLLQVELPLDDVRRGNWTPEQKAAFEAWVESGGGS